MCHPSQYRITASEKPPRTLKNWLSSLVPALSFLGVMTGLSPFQSQFSVCQFTVTRGGAIVYRVALWYPELVTHLFSVCTPYRPPSKTFVPLEELVKTKLPNFTYQLQFGGKSVEEAVVSRQQIREFLNLAYGGRGPNGEVGFTSREGVRLDMLSKANDTVLVSKEVSLSISL